MATMTINPAFLQSALLKNKSKNPYSAVDSTADVTAKQTGAAMRDMLAQREYGLRNRMNEANIIDMSNRLKLREQYLGLANQQQDWREKNWRKSYDTEKQNMWTTTALGLGTSAWSAYEGNRRAELLRAETKKNNETMDEFRKRYLSTGGTP